MVAMPETFADDRIDPDIAAVRTRGFAGRGWSPEAAGVDDDVFHLAGRHGFADRAIWARIDAELTTLRAAGRRSVRIVDAGCGPGMWLIRTVERACALGFTAIEGHGIDTSAAMIALARRGTARSVNRRIGLTFEKADIVAGLTAERDCPADLVLCLHGVLNHLPPERHAEVTNALAAAGRTVIVTVRTAGARRPIDAVACADLFARHGRIVGRLALDLPLGRGASDCEHCAPPPPPAYEGLIVMNKRDLGWRLGGAALFVAACGSSLVYRQIAAGAAGQPASPLEIGLSLLSFVLASFGVLLLIQGARLHDSLGHARVPSPRPHAWIRRTAERTPQPSRRL